MNKPYFNIDVNFIVINFTLVFTFYFMLYFRLSFFCLWSCAVQCYRWRYTNVHWMLQMGREHMYSDTNPWNDFL